MTRRQALDAERSLRPTLTAPPAPSSARIAAGPPQPTDRKSRTAVPPVAAVFSGRRRSTYQAVPATVLVRQPGRHRFSVTGPLTLAAIVLASALTLTHALPSYAVPESVQGDAVAVYNAETDEVQTLTVADAKAVIVSHDGYTVVAAPPPPPQATQHVTGVSRAAGAPVGAGQSVILWPFASPSPISSGFGPRKAPCGGCSSNHKGLDFTPGSGTHIQAIAGGVVRQVVSSDSGLGVHVVIEHEIDGAKLTSTYAHMQFGSLRVKKGQVVAAGAPVGRVGNTGASTGAHLHFEIAIGGKQIDPYAWLKAFAG